MRVGITGQVGFVGMHLYNWLGLAPDKYTRIPFEDSYFESPEKMKDFVADCDIIVHLAAMNRHQDPEVIYHTNIELVNKLITAMEERRVKPHILFSSSTQETLDNLYGKSKSKGRELLEEWAMKNQGDFSCLVIPNVFGEFSQPNYNTFIATFAHKIVNGEEPKVMTDNEVRLIYIASLCKFIMSQFGNKGINRVEVPFDFEAKVSDILNLFFNFKSFYLEKGIIPLLRDENEINLFNTFRSYISPCSVELVKHSDERGIFVETIKLGIGGQVSFSTTVPGITRGNHFHTRKIERFTVMKGKALIQLRKIGSEEVLDFEISGDNPGYVDMPVWYTHNIKNIGEEELYTQFWINEWYDPTDGDTYFEKV